MISWIIIGVLLVVGIAAIKFNHLRHRFFIVMLVFLALFLYTSITFLAEKNDLGVDNSEDVVNILKVYNGWLANGFKNMKSIAGNVIKMDWTSTNASFFEEE
jgi:hypothetical protein